MPAMPALRRSEHLHRARQRARQPVRFEYFKKNVAYGVLVPTAHANFKIFVWLSLQNQHVLAKLAFPC